MGKKFVRRGTSGAWWGLLMGCLIAIGSLLHILTEGGGYIGWRGVYVPIWVDWILLPLGIGITAVSIYALIRNRGKPTYTETYTDEEFAQAEAEMDAMYLREHGELPNKPKPEPEKPELEKLKEATK